MDVKKILDGVQLVTEVISAEQPDSDKVKTVVKAVALGYSKLLPKVDPKLKELPLDEQFVQYGMAAFASVGIMRTAYQTVAGKITVEEGAEKVSRIVSSVIASAPKVMSVLGHVHPTFKAAAVVLDPVCKALAPSVAEKIRNPVRKILLAAKNTVCQFGRKLMQAGVQKIAARIFG